MGQFSEVNMKNCITTFLFYVNSWDKIMCLAICQYRTCLVFDDLIAKGVWILIYSRNNIKHLMCLKRYFWSCTLIYLPTCFTHLFIYIHTYLDFYLCIYTIFYLSIYLPNYSLPSIYSLLSYLMTIYPSFYLSGYLANYLFIYLSIYLTIYLSIYLIYNLWSCKFNC